MATGGKLHGSALLTASGTVGVAGKAKIIYGFHVISTGGGASLVTLNNNGSGGVARIVETGTTGTGKSFNYSEGFFFPTDCYFVAGSNLTSILVSYDEYQP